MFDTNHYSLVGVQLRRQSIHTMVYSEGIDIGGALCQRYQRWHSITPMLRADRGLFSSRRIVWAYFWELSQIGEGLFRASAADLTPSARGGGENI